MTLSNEGLKSKAIEFGFNIVGITPAKPSPTLDAYFTWIDANHARQNGLYGAS